MTDPIVGAAIVKSALGSAEKSAQKATPGLMSRVLGPSADEIGAALARWTAYKVRNVGHIIEAADRKSDYGISGEGVHPRVAHQVLDSGSYCDDELMAEYYGGLLAASRTPDGRDDRAVSWSALVSGMSSIQIRAHYLLYREWAARLHGLPLNLGMARDRIRTIMDVDTAEFIPSLKAGSDLDAYTLISDAIVGLARLNLLDNNYTFGPRDSDNAPDSPYEYPMRVQLTPSGLELYGWAQGMPGVNPTEFTNKAVAFGVEPPMARLANVTLRLLNAQGSQSASAGSSGTMD